MPRILISECKQEISSFNPVLAHYEDFLIDRGPQLFDYHRPIRSEVGGALNVFDQAPGLELVPGYSARGITSSGPVATEDFRRLAGEFLAATQAAGRLDGIYYSLHGALAAISEDDVEGYLLAETRKIVGEQIPIVASFDLHGIITDRILQHTDAITLFYTNPHVDFYQTGQRAARLLLKILDNAVRPTTVRVSIPALVRGQECITATGMWGECVRRCIELETSPGGLSGGMFIGNPFTDVPDLCSNVVLVTDNDPARAEREALSIATQFWEMRHHLQQPLTSLEQSVRLAAAAKGRVVLVDAADATSSGAPGDSNAILSELIRQNCPRTALVPIVDAAAAQAAFQSGVGNSVSTTVGGSLDPRFQPLPITGRVRLLSDGHMRSESHGEAWYAGPTAVVETGPITLVIMSRPVSLYDRTPFLVNGQDPATFDMTVVKSPLCQPRFFADGAEMMINVDAAGATSANLKSLGHTVCRRPIFPLDDDVTFTPAARHFSRTKA